MNSTSIEKGIEKINHLIDELKASQILGDPSQAQDILELLDECRSGTNDLVDTLELKDKQCEVLKQNVSPKTHFGFLFSKNHEMQRLFIQAEKLKDLPAPIVILGEKGSGKEALARAIHLKSYRRGPFYIFNTTSPITQSDATLYFSEVQLVTPEKQAGLIKFLTAPPSRVRIIISTSQLTELEPIVLGRIKPVTLRILPLRERKEDILHLVDVFIREFSENKKDISDFSSSALNKLLEYRWPGNVGELKLEIKRIFMDFPSQRYYTLSHLSEKIVGASLKELYSIIQDKEKLPKAIEILERKLVLESLMKNSWNKSKVSRELGISRSGLIQKVEKYHLDRIYFPAFSTTKRRMSSRNSSLISIN